MKRIIINYADSIKDKDVLAYVQSVIDNGKVSGGIGKRKKQYCYLSLFSDGTEVYCPERYKQKSERFDVNKKL